jgi:hypothetical protein
MSASAVADDEAAPRKLAEQAFLWCISAGVRECAIRRAAAIGSGRARQGSCRW